LNQDLEIKVVWWPANRKSELSWILEESFEGWYLRHSMMKLRECNEVLVACNKDAQPVGLAILEKLQMKAGYIFYIAVARYGRGAGVGSRLLDEALKYFNEVRFTRVFAAVEQENIPSLKLFMSKGFTKTGFGELVKTYGFLTAISMYRQMVVVPGEILLVKELCSTAQ
jgi:ribosomal protein S18 acetylase RimI-like enzyme